MPLSQGDLAQRVARRYRVTKVLGEGGMGIVYDAVDDERGHRVALKTLKQPSPEALYRLKREFRAMADVHHPNVVQLYDLVVGAESVSYSMEVVEGVDFVSYCRPRSKTDPNAGFDISSDTTIPEVSLRPDRPTTRADVDRLRKALAQLAGALLAMHRAGLVHRDVKPSNVLVTRDGRVVLLDFGLAADQASIERPSMTGLVGTIAYMSPEQASEATEIGAASDWYAVGVMLYEALTGRLPHEGRLLDVLTAKRTVVPRRPSDLVAGVPRDLDELVMRLLAPREHERAGDAEVTAMTRGGRGDAAASSTLAPRFVGRDAELERLDAAVDQVRKGGAAVAWIEGPSGIGKSALVAEILARIGSTSSGAVVLRGRCYEQELVPFKAMDVLIDELSRCWRRLDDAEAAAILPRSTAALVRLFPVLARVRVVADAPSSPESRDPLEIRARAFAALRELLQRLSDRRLLVLFLDDMQWVDGDTINLLEELLRPPDPPRLLLLIASRSEVGTRTFDDALGRMQVPVHRLTLGPLPADEARSLARSLLGADHDAVAERVVREAAGSPFFLGELVRYLQTVGESESETVQIADVVRRRISLLSASARGLLELVTVAGEPVRVRDLAAAARADAEQVARDVRVLRIDHLVRAAHGRDDDLLEPYHNRIRAAILDQLDADTRRQHHRALAVALGGDAAPARLARHWAGAGERQRAASHAQVAGARAVATFDYENACELYRMALELGDYDVEARRQLEVELGGALRSAGRSSEAAETFMAAAVGADSMQRLELQRSAAELLLTAGVIERGVGVLREVLADIGETFPDKQRGALRTFLWYDLRARVRSGRWTARDASQIPPRELLRLDCYISLGLTLAFVDTMVGAMYQAKGLATALRLGEPTRLFRITMLYAVFLGAQGGRSLRRGRRLIERAATIVGVHEGLRAAYREIAEAFFAYFDGDLDTAVRRTSEAERLLQAETTGSVLEVNNVRIIECQSLRLLGKFTTLRERYDDHVRDARQRGDLYLASTLHRSVNLVWLAEDNPGGARESLMAAAWAPPDRGFHLQHWYQLRANSELALYTGELESDALRAPMDALCASPLVRIQTVRCDAAWLRMRLALAGASHWDPKRAIALLEREDIAYAAVWAGLGKAALARGDRRAALLEATATKAEAICLHACALAARWRLCEERGDGGTAAIAARFAELGVRRPERMIEVLAPGFAGRTTR